MNLLSTSAGRKFLFGLLYLSEGAPIGFIWWALPTRMRTAGVPIEEITSLTSLIVLPWVLKFLWAPLIDTLRSRRWTLRHWIIASQSLMGLTLLPLLWLDFKEDFNLIIPLLLIHAFVAATQDVSIDAMAIATVSSNERGALNGWMQAGYLVGRGLLGGGTLLLDPVLGSNVAVLLLVGVVFSTITLLFLMKEEWTDGRTSVPASGRWPAFHASLKMALRQKITWLGLLFALVAGAGFESVGAVAGPFLIDRGFSSEQVGIFFGVPTILGMLAGALVGGYGADKLGHSRAAGLFLILLSIVIVLLGVGDMVLGGAKSGWLIVLLTCFYVCIGMFTASSYALFMNISNRALGATQFSSYMGATNACESWASLAVGRLQPSFGYPLSFVVMALVSLAALPVLGLLSYARSSPEDHAP